ncbi:MAG: RNA 2'-phosphotransferase [bacterium]
MLTKKERNKLKIEVLKILTDEPEKTGLSPDRWGFVNISELISMCEIKVPWAKEEWVRNVITEPIFEVAEDSVRAISGHKYYIEPQPEKAVPPNVLYATVPKIMLNTFLKKGLSPINDRYVYLYQSIDEAWYFTTKSGSSYIIISVMAEEAHQDGVEFFLSDRIYLAKRVPTRYLSVHIDRKEEFNE